MARFLNGAEQELEQRINGSRTSTVMMVPMHSAVSVLHPDTEENVEAQTEEIFLNYVYQSYRIDSVREETDDLSPVPALLNLATTQISPAAEIGRHLARLGDDLNEKYGDMFDGMIYALNLTADEESSYEAFTNIGRRVFASGINWGRIMILLSFGYRMAKTFLRTHAPRFAIFLTRIVSFVYRFLVSERISTWIANHGGWIAALSYIPNASTGTFLLVSGLAVASVFALITFHKFFK